MQWTVRIGRRIKLHTIPELHFVFDQSVKDGARLSELIDRAVATSVSVVPGDTER